MMYSPLQQRKITQSLVLSLATALLLSIDTVSYARGYGAGNDVGEFYNDYMPRAQARFFALHDTNGNGFLSSTEVTEMKMSTQTFKQADINNDDRLSRDEFVKIQAQPSTNSDMPAENY